MKKDNTEKCKENNEKNYSFEFSFSKLRLKAIGKNQEEIRKTIIRTWWLPISFLLVSAIVIILSSKELIEKLILLFFNN